jgi:hypothetical protein
MVHIHLGHFPPRARNLVLCQVGIWCPGSDGDFDRFWLRDGPQAERLMMSDNLRSRDLAGQIPAIVSGGN